MREGSPRSEAWAFTPRGEAPFVRPRTPPVVRALLAVWLGLVTAGAAGIWHYKLTPGEPARLARRFPATSSLSLALRGPTLILFAHPECPCTRATLAELRRILSPFTGKVAAHVVFVDVYADAGAFSTTDTTELANSIPGVVVTRDPGGKEAALFGATTSGNVVVYDTLGALAYSGGITPARGHEGDSPGGRRVREILTRETAGHSSATASGAGSLRGAVYGCPLKARR